ncbi:MAG: hypothetical protein Q4E57_08205 [Eubacteriales bacterium]|nr:hypothetical protein [Eubacteriales bacterium]
MQNPFTTTFSKAPEYTYIATDEISEILENLSYDRPSESVYKITGVRGSGKTVILAKLEAELRERKNWIVCDLNPNRDLLHQLAAILHKEGYGENDTKSKNLNISANVLGTGGSIGFGTETENPYFDIGVELDAMIQAAAKDSRKIFVGIDEVSKTAAMIEFAAELGKWVRADFPVYLVCTGLYENIQEVSNVKNLTFFRRATTIKTGPLNTVRMTEMYKNVLSIDTEEAKAMALCTKGYAFAFQQLGVLYFKRKPSEKLPDVLPALQTELFAYSYEKIWEELTENERLFLHLLKEQKEYKREELLKLMGDRQGSYSVYRDRLIKKGIINVRQGYISLALPYFTEYIKEYWYSN